MKSDVYDKEAKLQPAENQVTTDPTMRQEGQEEQEGQDQEQEQDTVNCCQLCLMTSVSVLWMKPRQMTYLMETYTWLGRDSWICLSHLPHPQDLH